MHLWMGLIWWIDCCHPMVRVKRWWWPSLSNVINVSIVALWGIHCAANDALDFPSTLGYQSYESRTRGGKAPGWWWVDISPSVCLDGIGHNRIHCSQGVHGLVALPIDYLSCSTRSIRSASEHSIINASCRTDPYIFSFLPRTVSDWNKLSEGVQLKPSVVSFRQALYKPIDSPGFCWPMTHQQ